MPLSDVEYVGHDWNRRSVTFTAFTGADTITCAVSYEAMDDEERRPGRSPEPNRQRQFERLKNRIVEAAARKFFGGDVEVGDAPKVLVTSHDLGAVPRGIQ